jgi:hypothetical protein
VRHYTINMTHGLTTFTCLRCKRSVTTAQFSGQNGSPHPSGEVDE